MLDITIKREVASSYGILPFTIDNTLDDAFGQRIVSTMYTALNQYHVIMEVNPKFQYSPEALTGIYVKSSTGQEVPLSTLVDSVVKVAPLVVNHQGQFPSVTISFNLLPGTAIGEAPAPSSTSNSNSASRCRCRRVSRATRRPSGIRCRPRRS